MTSNLSSSTPHEFKDGICLHCAVPITEDNFSSLCDKAHEIASRKIHEKHIQSLLAKRSPFMFREVEINLTDTVLELCEHECKCGHIWSHGLLSKCRVPRQFSPCPDCLHQITKETPKSPTVNEEIAWRNDEMRLCTEMSLDELNAHIQALDEKMRELRARGSAARVTRADKEKESGITDEDRARFRAQRDASKVNSAKPKVQGVDKATRDIERAIVHFMKLGMSREKAERTVRG